MAGVLADFISLVGYVILTATALAAWPIFWPLFG